MKNNYIFQNKKITVRRVALFQFLQFSLMSNWIQCSWIWGPASAFKEQHYHIVENSTIYSIEKKKANNILAFNHLFWNWPHRPTEKVPRPHFENAAAAKSLQSCPTLCDPIDGSPPGFPIPGILQARTLAAAAAAKSLQSCPTLHICLCGSQQTVENY